ncbi:transposase, partial [candidate division KSB1 bacterium]|nr:transposase [candidate division KSB1 bacterium]
LFDRPFRRKMIESEVYRAQLIFYIHNNPRHHGVCEDFRYYPHSSYKAMLSQAPTNLMRSSVLDWFEGPIGFIDFHQREHDIGTIRDYILE